MRFVILGARALLLTIGCAPFAACFAGPALAQDDGAAPAASAEGSEADGRTEEIIVTAQFREENLQDIPLAVTAVTGAMIEARSQTNLADLTAQAPSVVLKPATPAYGPSITAAIRGMGQIDFNPAYEPGVGIYIDDVYYPRLIGANFDLLDLERIEILRGPQGTLTGRNSEGGAIRFISRRPNGADGGYIAATYGSRDRIGLRGAAGFTIAKNLFARVSGTFADQDGYVKQIDFGCAHPGQGVAATRAAGKCTVSKFGDVGYKAVKGIVRWAPSDRIDAMISADYAKDKRRNSAEVLLYGKNINPNVQAGAGVPLDSRFICGRFCNFATDGQPAAAFVAGAIPALNGLPLAATAIDNEMEYSSWGLSGRIAFDLADAAKLTSISAYREWKSRFSQDADLSPARVGNGANALDSKYWSQELRLNAKLADWVDLTLGGFYSHEKTTYFTKQDVRYVAVGSASGPPPFPLPLFPLQFIGDDPVKVVSKALFGTVIVKPVAALTLTGGLRYTREAKDYTFFRYNYDGATINAFLDPVGAACGIGFSGVDTGDCNHNGNSIEVLQALSGTTARFRGSRWDYRASLDYRFNPEILAYATVSTGFKGGGIGPRPFNAAQARPFGPEKLTAFEVGFKTDLFDRRLRFNVAAYYNRFKDAQLTLQSCPQFGGPGPCALPQNAGNADVKGIEAEIFFRPLEGLQIDASGSLLDWDWKCVDPRVLGLPGTGQCDASKALVDRLSSPPRGVSKHQWSIGAEYRIDLAGAGSLTPRIDVSHQGKLLGTATVPAAGSPSALFSTVDSYTMTNVRLTWRNADRDLEASLEVSNLFDRYYFLGKFDLTSAGAGTISGLPGRPREWAVTVKKTF
ncbi:MAG TPA: TonB-dependent receptor [Allosphingosinicella sp.]|nr:TonB-dependent receptor [Allosphingosinicella sp.]